MEIERLTVSLPKPISDKLKKKAKKNQRSASAEIVIAVHAHVTAK